MFGRTSDPKPGSTEVGAHADAALDHALRESEVDETSYDELTDGPDGSPGVAAVEADDAAQQAALEDDTSAAAADAPAGEEQEYVLYSEVEPHLRELVALQKERGRLIDLLLYAADRVSSPAAADRIDSSLRDLGIESLRPDGQPFDPSQHEASATVSTTDAALHGTVAETETPGYSDNGRLVRPPIVTVYRAEGVADAGSAS